MEKNIKTVYTYLEEKVEVFTQGVDILIVLGQGMVKINGPRVKVIAHDFVKIKANNQEIDGYDRVEIWASNSYVRLTGDATGIIKENNIVYCLDSSTAEIRGDRNTVTLSSNSKLGVQGGKDNYITLHDDSKIAYNALKAEELQEFYNKNSVCKKEYV